MSDCNFQLCLSICLSICLSLCFFCCLVCCTRHAQILGTLQAFSHWLCQLNLDTLRSTQAQPGLQQTLHSLITTLVGAVTPLIVGGMPEKVVLPACQYLLSLVSTVKPRFLASLPSVQGLMERGAQGKLVELPNKVSGRGYSESVWLQWVGGVCTESLIQGSWQSCLIRLVGVAIVGGVRAGEGSIRAS